MKRLTLIRHAKSSWKDLLLPDSERPLNGRGKRDAPLMGARLAIAGFKPELIVTSPAKRARKTAAAISKQLSRHPDIVEDPRIYGAGTTDLLDLIGGLPIDLEDVAIVGHNPGLTELANLLADAGIGNVPTTGVVRLELDIALWSEVEPGLGRLVDFDWPKRQT